MRKILFAALLCLSIGSLIQAQNGIDAYLDMSQADMAKNFSGEEEKYNKGFCQKDDKLISGIVERGYYNKDGSTVIRVRAKEVKYSGVYSWYIKDSSSWYKDEYSLSVRSVVVIGDLIYRLDGFDQGINDEKFDIYSLHAKNDNTKLIKSMDLEQHKEYVKTYLKARKEYIKKVQAEKKASEELNTTRGKKIEKIEIEFIESSTILFETNTTFTIGYKTTVEGGYVIKSENLGGKQPMVEYTLEIKGAKKVDDKWKVDYCDYLEKGDKLYIKLTNIFNKEAVFEQYYHVECIDNPSVSAKYAKKWEIYDKVTAFNKDRKEFYSFKMEKTDNQSSRDYEVSKMVDKEVFGLIKVEKNGKFGFATNQGDLVLDVSYDKVNPFNPNSLALVQKANKYGVINMQGRFVIPLEYDNAYPEFTDGLIGMKKNGKVGFLNEKGVVAVPLIYEGTERFVNGFAQVKNNAKWGFIDKTGKVVVELIYDETKAMNDDGMAWVKKEGKVGMIDKTGKVIIPIMYENAFYRFTNGLLGVQQGGKQGFIDWNNKAVIPFIYDKVFMFSCKIARVQKDGYIQYINNDGSLLTSVKFKKGEDFVSEMEEVEVITEDGTKLYMGNGGTLWEKDENNKYTYYDPSGLADEPEEEESNTASVTKPNNSGTKTDTKKVTTCFILNDLKPEQQTKYGDIKLTFSGYRLARTSVSRTHKLEVDCDDVKVYKEKKENSTAYGDFLFETKGRCGETIKLSDYW